MFQIGNEAPLAVTGKKNPSKVIPVGKRIRRDALPYGRPF